MGKAKTISINSLSRNKYNPRRIKEEKSEKLLLSLLSFPKMLSLRPIVVDRENDNAALGGNMRFLNILEIIALEEEAYLSYLNRAKDLAHTYFFKAEQNKGKSEEEFLEFFKSSVAIWNEVRQTREIPASWVAYADGLDGSEKRTFVVLDNVGFGEWDWDLLANIYDPDELEAMAVDIPNIVEEVEEEAEEEKDTVYQIEVTLISEGEQKALLSELEERGFECKAISM